MSTGQAIRLHLVSASFVDDADGFVAAFGSLTEWNHVDRAGNDLTGVAPIAEGTHRLLAGPKAPSGFQPGRRHRPALSRGEGTDRLSAGQAGRVAGSGKFALQRICAKRLEAECV